MKKLLLSLMLSVLAFGAAWAGTVTNSNYVTGTAITWSDGTATVKQEKWGGSANPNSKYATSLRVYQYHALVFDAGEGNSWDKFEYTVNSVNYGNGVKWGSSDSEITKDNYTDATNGTGSAVKTNGGSGTLYFNGGRYAYIYNGGTTNLQLQITSFTATYVSSGKTATSLSFDKEEVTAYLDALNEYVAPVLTKNPTDLAVTYSIAGDEIGTLATDGTLAINAVGTAVVTASYAGNDDYTASSASYTIKVLAQKPTYLFYESFDTNNGKGANDESWGGSIAQNDIKSDHEEWTFVSGNGAYKCAKFGTSSAKGSATTPAFNTTGKSELVVKFKAGAWDGNSENTTLKLSTVGGGTLDKTEVTLVKGQWSDYTVYVTNATSATKIKFEGAQAKNSRFFLDEVYVYEYVAPAAPTCNLTLNEEVDDEEYIELLDENEYACIDGVYYANVVSLTDNNGYVNTGIEITTNSVTYTRENIDSDKWHAVCLPFAVPASDWKQTCGFSVIKLHETQEEENAVVFEHLADDADMLANTPYLIKDNEELGEISLSATKVVLGEAVSKVEHEGNKISMVGTFENTTLQNTAEVSYYALKDGVFTTVKEGHSINLKPFRAYLQVKANTPGTLNIRIHDTEGIQSIEAAQMEDGVFYNLQGIRVDKPTKGMYIFNGHKVILK